MIEVSSWSATLAIAADPDQSTLALDADAGSLEVQSGSGGIQELGDDDKREIERTIDDEVLKRHPIEFRATRIDAEQDGRLRVSGDLGWSAGRARSSSTFGSAPTERSRVRPP